MIENSSSDNDNDGDNLISSVNSMDKQKCQNKHQKRLSEWK